MKMPKCSPVESASYLRIVFPDAAGLDIGASEIMVAIPPDREGVTVRGFGTYHPGFGCPGGLVEGGGVTHVAMELTGRVLDPRLRSCWKKSGL